jgi:translation initiation factor 3 subunit G
VDFKWGEQDEDDEEKVTPAPTRPQSVVSGPDKDGNKTNTEYRTDEATGKKLQVVRKVKETRVSTLMNKNVLARRQWKKFGKCAKLPPGPEPGATFTSHDNIVLQLKCKKREDDTLEEDDEIQRKLIQKESVVTCSHCGERGHWSLKCPKRDTIVVVQKNRPNEEPSGRSETSGDSRRPGGGDSEGSKYVPVHMRPTKGGDSGSNRDRKPGDAQQRDEDSSNQIRVTNISEDTTENDLRELFRRFGTTSRIYLAKDKGTNQSRGFAFITYTSRADAQKAIDRLNGYGYGNLILHVEFAKPREEDGVKSQGAGNRAGWQMAGTK